eukprot:9920910-Alexandrium_andersonii.AAC.1
MSPVIGCRRRRCPAASPGSRALGAPAPVPLSLVSSLRRRGAPGAARPSVRAARLFGRPGGPLELRRYAFQCPLFHS